MVFYFTLPFGSYLGVSIPAVMSLYLPFTEWNG
jgi:hypothetical protein